MNLLTVKFESAELDELIAKFMKEELDIISERKLLHILETNHRFRESFADWMRSSRSLKEWHQD